MILTSTTERVAFPIPWIKGDAPPTFQLRAASVIERGQFEAELSGRYRAGKVWGFELIGALRRGVQTLLADDPELDRLNELLSAAEQGEEATLSDDDQRLLAEVRGVLAEHWPEYRDLVAQIERRREIAPILALKWFCVGWESCTDGGDNAVPFATGADGRVSDGALGRLKELELKAAGNRAFALQYANGQEGNSQQPSQSDDGQPSSSSDATSKAVGKSATKRGRKTLA